MGFSSKAAGFSFAGAAVVFYTTGINGATAVFKGNATGLEGAARAVAGAFAAAFFSAIAFSKAFMGLVSDGYGLGLLAEIGMGAVILGVFDTNLLSEFC